MDYKITDYEQACALRACKLGPKNIEIDPQNDKRCFFVFDDSPRVREVARKFGAAELKVNVLELTHAMRDLKAWMYSITQNS